MQESVDKKPASKLIIRFSIFAVVVIALISTVLFLSSRLDTPPNYSGGKVVGKLVPDVTVVALDGEEIALRELIGKRVIINFFNSWCIPCQEEEPNLQTFAKKYGSDPDFVFIGIARDDSEKNIRDWASERNAPFDVTLDPNNEAALAFGTTGQPETYAIDRNGRVVASLLARANDKALDELWEATK